MVPVAKAGARVDATPPKPAGNAASAKPVAPTTKPAAGKAAGKPATPPANKPATPPANKPAAPASGEKPKDVATVASNLLGATDTDTNGSAQVAGEGVKTLGTLASNGVSVQVDRRALLGTADNLGNGDGTVTAAELTKLVGEFDRDNDGKLSGKEIAAYRSWSRAATDKVAIAADGARTEAVRGFFQQGGEWFFRNEWGSVARAQNVPQFKHVVDAPAGFDAAGVPPAKRGASNVAGPGGATPPQSVVQKGKGARGGPGGAAQGAAAVFNGAGIFVDNPANFSIDQAKAAREAGFSWIAAQGYNTDDKGSPVQRAEFTTEWVDQMHALGFKVGIWGVLGTQPVDDARMASNLVNSHQLDFFIADAEASHKADTGGDPARSAAFTNEFRSLQPTAALALSSYAASPFQLGSVNDAQGGPMNYKAWHDAGAVFMPQVYPEEFGEVYSVEATMSHAQRAGWDPSLVKPTLGFHRGETPEYYANLAATGIQGFSVYLGENVSDTSYWARLMGLGVAA